MLIIAILVTIIYPGIQFLIRYSRCVSLKHLKEGKLPGDDPVKSKFLLFNDTRVNWTV